MNSRLARVARGTAAASFATFVAAFSHSLAGGSTSWLGLTAALVIAIMVCTLLTARTLSLWRLALSIGASQFLFHALFGSVGTPVIVQHTMQSVLTMHTTDAPLAHSHTASTMWLAHVVAALATVLAFRFGEKAFWSVADTARLLLARLLVVTIPVLAIPRPVVAVDRRFVPSDLALLLSSMRHRGPPVVLSA